MLLREFRDNLQKLTKRKITNEYLGNLFGTSPQNISKRIKNDSKVTVEEVELAQKDLGVVVFARTNINNSYTIKENPNNFSLKNWGQNIQKLRAENNLSIDNFCKLTGITESNLIAYVNDDKEPTISDLIKIKNHFNISIDNLLFKNDDTYNQQN